MNQRLKKVIAQIGSLLLLVVPWGCNIRKNGSGSSLSTEITEAQIAEWRKMSAQYQSANHYKKGDKDYSFAKQSQAEMAFLSLESLYLQRLQNIADIMNGQNSAEVSRPSAGLNLVDESPDEFLKRTQADVQRVQAEANAASLLQKAHVDTLTQQSDAWVKATQFYQGWDKQKFDQSIQAAQTGAEVAAKNALTAKTWQDVVWGGIKNEILSTFSKMYATYSSSYMAYNSAIMEAFKGAEVSAQKARKFMTAVSDFYDGVEQCERVYAQEIKRELSYATARLRAENLENISIGAATLITSVYSGAKEVPLGGACAELAFIEVNQDALDNARDVKAYVDGHPIFELKPDVKAMASSNKRVGCPAYLGSTSGAEEAHFSENIAPLMSLAAHDAGLQNEDIMGASTELKLGLDGFDFDGKFSPGIRKNAKKLEPEIWLNTLFATKLADPKTQRSGQTTLTAFPVTMWQLAEAISSGGFVTSGNSQSGAVCDFYDNKSKDYISASLIYESERKVKLLRDLKDFGVDTGVDGRLFRENQTGYVTGSLKTSRDKVSHYLRKGFEYNRTCQKVVSETLAAKNPATVKKVELPAQPTVIQFGGQNFSFHYPQYALGRPTSTAQEFSGAVRRCVDSKMSRLATAHISLQGLSEYYAAFNNMAAIKAPASPIQWIENPAPASNVNAR